MQIEYWITGWDVCWLNVFLFDANWRASCEILKYRKEIQEVFSDFPWADVNAFRNYINHDYSNVKPKIVIDTIINDVPRLIYQLEEIRIYLEKELNNS